MWNETPHPVDMKLNNVNFDFFLAYTTSKLHALGVVKSFKLVTETASFGALFGKLKTGLFLERRETWIPACFNIINVFGPYHNCL